jgi:hypothetical protein
MRIFRAEGDFAQIHIASEVPKIASGNRLSAAPEEYAGIMRGTIAQFGTYTMDEDKQTFTMKFMATTAGSSGARPRLPAGPGAWSHERRYRVC